MASIIELIKNIRNARLGKDVRESIASAIEQTYEDATEKGSSNMEVAQARGTFDTLRERLNNSDSVKADKIEVQKQINSLASGSPLVASSISEMTDTTRVYVNTTDGYWYTYDGSSWIARGIYQSTGIEDNSITLKKLSEEYQKNVAMNSINVIDLLSYFEIGGITITNEGWTYSNDTRRARTRQGTTIFLEKGTIFVIPTDKRVYIGYKIGENYYTKSWATGVYIIPNTANYVFLLANIENERNIESLTDFLSGFKILKSNLVNVRNQINNIKNALERKYVTGGIYQLGATSTSGIVSRANRAYNVEFMKFQEDTNILITGNSNQNVAIKAYRTANYADYISNSDTGWLELPAILSCNKDWYYSIDARYSDDSNIEDITTFSKYIKIDANQIKKAETEKYNTPKMVYHRGMQSCRPENTIPAFEFCKRLNLKYIECDVHATSDDVPIIIHDTDISRVTNGTGEINNIAYNDLKRLYVTGVMYIAPYNNTLRVPSFEEFIKYCRENDMYPFIELKETLQESTIKKIVDLIYKYNMQKSCICFSFTLSLVQLIEKYSSEIRVAYMSTTYNITKLKEYLSLNNNKGFILDYSQINSDICDVIHNSGGFIGTYTVNDLSTMQTMIDNKVDFIITNSLLYNANINYQKENLYFSESGQTLSYTIPYNERKLFDDIFDLQVEVYSPSGNSVINIGNKEYAIPNKDEWQMIHLQHIPVPPESDTVISLTGTNCNYINCIINRYRSHI